jgi:hypothetical protein
MVTVRFAAAPANWPKIHQPTLGVETDRWIAAISGSVKARAPRIAKQGAGSKISADTEEFHAVSPSHACGHLQWAKRSCGAPPTKSRYSAKVVSARGLRAV